MKNSPDKTNWTIQDARELYNIANWGSPYFDINASGNISVQIPTHHPEAFDIYDIAQHIKSTGINWPVLLRITNILSDRVSVLNQAFLNANKKHQYHGKYTAVYPIKVNQQRTVIEHLVTSENYSIGLEAGSKPELMIVLSQAKTETNTIICNGYKDREYIQLALIGQKMGHQIFLVIEKISELDLILEESKKLNVTPLLGVRVRLSSIGKGKWQNTGGENSKFGLSASQVLKIVSKLKSIDMQHCLTLMHCHLGSQLANIRDIQKGMGEIAKYFSELHRLGVLIQHIDVGGGLGIDYEGSRSRNYCSMNYSISEYANDIVQALSQVCQQYNLPHPNIISESGRAMAAHHAILITNIVDSDSVLNEDSLLNVGENDPILLKNLHQSLLSLNKKNVVESYHDASHWLTEIQVAFNHGIINLTERAAAEQIYYQICARIRTLLSANIRTHQVIIDELNEKLSSKYFCNFSIFQSLPDIWAIDQIFPIIPLHRLNEKPTERVRFQDLTCDSDGTISHYIEYENIESTMLAHKLNKDETYLIGVFLVGAYQEILGDMHNLFGDTHAIDITLSDEGNVEFSDAEHGDTIEQILGYIHYNSTDIENCYKNKLEHTSLPKEEQAQYLHILKKGLKDYSYLVS